MPAKRATGHSPLGAKNTFRLLILALLLLALSPLGPPAQAAESPVYPVSGFFVKASTADAVNSQKLQAIKAVGGDTVITFGSRLTPSSLAGVPADCRIANVNCVQSATGGVLLNRVFTYSDSSMWGPSAIRCPRDRSINNNNRLFTVLVLPTTGTGCDAANNSYDVVVISGGNAPGASAVGSMARAATAQGVKFYAGMPIPVNRTDLAYLPDMSFKDTFRLFTERYLQYQAAANNVAGLAGFYLSTEMPLKDSAIFDPILAVYRIQNQAIRSIMPTRGAIVSPYIDSRAAASGRGTPAQAQGGARNIALTASGIPLSIAVQDGMGTGKGGAFNGNESGAPVDQFAAAIVGAGSWGSKYLAPNRDYYLAAAAGVAGTGAILWANMEGMAPAAGTNPCGANLRGQTTKGRIDRQLQQMANAPRKIISFMWDTYYTCSGTWVPMAQQLQNGKTTPIVTDASFNAGSGSLLVTGFNLSGARIELRWTTAAGVVQSNTVTASSYNPLFGRQQGLNPVLQRIGANVGVTSLGAGKYYMVKVTNGWGAVNPFYAKTG